ncbi:MAG: class I SAM-dependent methyltransferase [Rubrivivax sp.]|nr:MAG: class I SAM-dependent methyltransferase [Rubrivivax sp.]
MCRPSLRPAHSGLPRWGSPASAARGPAREFRRNPGDWRQTGRLAARLMKAGAMDKMNGYLEGQALYGDDMGPAEVEAWFRDEEEGYADMFGENDALGYEYHALNRYHGYRHIQHRSFKRLLGFGSAYGDELLPVLDSADAVTIIDPSDAFARSMVHGKPVTYVKPKPDGQLPLPSNGFDLVTCLGVLHHIPNVSAVMREIGRVLEPGGYMLLREPVVSMGDWRQPRRGLTKRERGIPIHIMRGIIEASGMDIVCETLCAFPTTHRMFRPLRRDPFNSDFMTRFDAVLSSLFAWNLHYHSKNPFQRLRPTAGCFVLRKKASA